MSRRPAIVCLERDPTEVDAARLRPGAALAYLTDPLTAVAELAHLAAYMFRARHDLCVSDDEEERRLIDLTALYLGFGIIMTNAAYRYRASGEMRWSFMLPRPTWQSPVVVDDVRRPWLVAADDHRDRAGELS